MIIMTRRTLVKRMMTTGCNFHGSVLISFVVLSTDTCHIVVRDGGISSRLFQLKVCPFINLFQER